jgi:hypothetical protein
MVKIRRTAFILMGAAGMFFLDPSQGKRRRAVTRDKVQSRLARRQRRAQQRASYQEGRRRGELFGRAGAGEFHRTDNQSVAEHLHSVIERADVATGDVTVEVVDDAIRLRGQVRTNDDRSRLLSAVGAEAGGRRLDSMLHLPNEPAPNKVASRRA